ncbi:MULTISPECIES: hypothetical protein [Myxococcaceae]|uniref:hypothetical protein n=1 Tax=Myxococcaceae TaxID=31 RepID=UPI0018902F66|nr:MULTISPECIES: hypothetical protein [Myxococcaceae]MBF5042045.1 hypothetical protein [Simulacricoccus sp. 17bor-14]
MPQLLATTSFRRPLVALLLVLGGCTQVPTLELVAPPPLEAVRGQQTPWTIEVRRGGGLSEPIEVSLLDLPTGVSASPVTIAADETQATLVLEAGVSAVPASAVAVRLELHASAVAQSSSAQLTVRDPGGAADHSFNATGIVASEGLVPGLMRACAVAGDAQGQSVTLNILHGDYLLEKRDAQGHLLASFGNRGQVHVGRGTDYGISECGLALLSDGSILVGGTFREPGDDYDAFVARYTADGSLDTTFGVEGFAVPSRSVGYLAFGFVSALQVDTARHIYIAATGGWVTRVVRLTANGTLDATFGTQGVATFEGADGTSIRGLPRLALAPDGSVLVASSRQPRVDPSPEWYLDLRRYTWNGRLDVGFGFNGGVTVEGSAISSGMAARVDALAVRPDGRIVVGELVWGDNSYKTCVVQYRADGTPDPAFGISGRQVLPTVGVYQYDSVLGLYPSADGKLTVANTAYNGLEPRFAVLRLISDGRPDPSFNGGRVFDVVTPLLPGAANDWQINPGGSALLPDGRLLMQADRGGGDGDRGLVLARVWL